MSPALVFQELVLANRNTFRRSSLRSWSNPIFLIKFLISGFSIVFMYVSKRRVYGTRTMRRYVIYILLRFVNVLMPFRFDIANFVNTDIIIRLICSTCPFSRETPVTIVICLISWSLHVKDLLYPVGGYIIYLNI